MFWTGHVHLHFHTKVHASNFTSVHNVLQVISRSASNFTSVHACPAKDGAEDGSRVASSGKTLQFFVCFICFFVVLCVRCC